MPPFATAKLILHVVAASYLLSAAILLTMRLRGSSVPTWIIAGWLVTGLLGVVLTAALGPGRGGVWWGLGAVLIPWMILALIGDLRLGHYVVAAIDVAGLAAIGFALLITYRAAAQS